MFEPQNECELKGITRVSLPQFEKFMDSFEPVYEANSTLGQPRKHFGTHPVGAQFSTIQLSQYQIRREANQEGTSLLCEKKRFILGLLTGACSADPVVVTRREVNF